MQRLAALTGCSIVIDKIKIPINFIEISSEMPEGVHGFLHAAHAGEGPYHYDVHASFFITISSPQHRHAPAVLQLL